MLLQCCVQLTVSVLYLNTFSQIAKAISKNEKNVFEENAYTYTHTHIDTQTNLY